MRWKIIVVNAGIVLVVGLLSYVMLATSLRDVLANKSQQKVQVAQALRAANAQLAVDALRLERWLNEQVMSDAVRNVYAGGTPEARSESATVAANRLRDAAVSEPTFAKMAPSLVLFVDEQGVSFGRNGSALMRGDNMGVAYPSLLEALKTGKTMSDVWLNRQRQEQLLVSYAPVRNEGDKVIGAVLVGTPLNDERLARTSELTSGNLLLLAVPTQADKLELVANSGRAEGGVIAAAAGQNVLATAQTALSTGNVTSGEKEAADHLFGATPLEGYGNGKRAVLIGAIPASLVSSLSGVLWPILGVTALGILLVIVGGVLLGNYISQPISELEDGLLAIINGNSELRFQLEHEELGGLVFRVNSLLNALMGVPEDTTDEQGRPSVPASANTFKEALSVDESSAVGQNVEPRVAAALAAEPVEQYYRRLYSEYIAAKRQLGDPVDHITFDAFVTRIQGSERESAAKYGRPVRFQVQLRDNAVILLAVPLPG
ncbi:MAG TPA: MXAN_5187 C-terminal domain-containing protein [Polyangiaceae bacterium]